MKHRRSARWIDNLVWDSDYDSLYEAEEKIQDRYESVVKGTVRLINNVCIRPAIRPWISQIDSSHKTNFRLESWDLGNSYLGY